MISKYELNQLAQKSGLHLYQQEKDYLLKLFLYLYYKKFNDAVFKGGTCLKYLFGIDRFSEDLDFNIKNSLKFKEQVKVILKDLSALGINSYFLKEESFEDSYTCEIGFSGPLFTGTKQTQNKIRIDAGYRTGTFKKPEWQVINSEYPEMPINFLVLVMDINEILVEKIVTLINRNKGRDLYDVWFMIKAGVNVNKKLLKKKAVKEKVLLNFGNIVTKKEYERDMTKLTSRLIPYEQVKKVVTEIEGMIK